MDVGWGGRVDVTDGEQSEAGVGERGGAAGEEWTRARSSMLSKRTEGRRRCRRCAGAADDIEAGSEAGDDGEEGASAAIRCCGTLFSFDLPPPCGSLSADSLCGFGLECSGGVGIYIALVGANGQCRSL